MKKLIHLPEQDIPDKWFNILPHLPVPIAAPQDVVDEKGSRIDIANKIRVPALQQQDTATESWIDIPPDVLSKYIEIGRPTPLMRAYDLEKYLDTPAKIYIKREDLLPTGSFKLNTSIAQAYFASKANAEGLVSETGAGQWGMGLAYACNIFNLKCIVFWVKVSLEQKPDRADSTKLLGGQVFPSPSIETESGREILSKDPECPGSIGTGIGDAISYVMNNGNYKYVSGSNLPHVLLHQSIIGLETKRQLEMIGEKPDVLVACVGGGSNLGGFMNPFIFDKLERNGNLELIAAESDAAPRLTKGVYQYDHSDPVGLTPKVLSYSMGSDFIPPATHVGGLRQHNGSPIIGSLRHSNLLQPYSFSQKEAFDAGKIFIEKERIIPAPETNHAILATMNAAFEAKKQNKKKVIVMCFSGHGLLDMQGYREVLNITSSELRN